MIVSLVPRSLLRLVCFICCCFLLLFVVLHCPAAVVALLVKGHPTFDRRTGTSAVATLVSNLGVDRLTTVLREVRAGLSADVAKGVTREEDDDVRAARRDFGRGAASETRLAWAIQALTGGGKNARCVEGGGGGYG